MISILQVLSILPYALVAGMRNAILSFCYTVAGIITGGYVARVWPWEIDGGVEQRERKR